MKYFMALSTKLFSNIKNYNFRLSFITKFENIILPPEPFIVFIVDGVFIIIGYDAVRTE
jgi:hypothetical protein